MTTRVWTAAEVRALGVRTDLETAASVLGIGRTTAYELARRDAFPTKLLRLGTRYVCPVASILRALDLEDTAEAQPGGTTTPGKQNADPHYEEADARQTEPRTGGPSHALTSPRLEPVRAIGVP